MAGQTVSAPDGRRLEVCVWGDPAGAPVFWLHGTPGSRLLRHPGDSYLDHRLRVVTYDRPGYGLSTRVRGRRAADVADDVRAIADALDLDRFGVAGVSGGGPGALAATALLPDRVVRCGVVAGPAPFSADGLDFAAGMADDERQEWQLAVDGAAALEPSWLEFRAWLEVGLPDVPADYRSIMMEMSYEAGRQGSAGYVDDYLSLVDEWGFTLEDVRASTRIMVAREDTSVPVAHGEWLVRRLPAGELIMVDGGRLGPGHEPEVRLLAWVGHGTP